MASAQRVAASSDELSKFLPELKLRKSELVPPPTSHGSIATNKSGLRWLNTVVGWLGGLMLLSPFPAFRMVHLKHHKHCNDPGPSWLLPIKWALQETHYYVFYFTRARSRPAREVMQIAAFIVVVVGALWYLCHNGHGHAVLLHLALPRTFAIVILAFTFDYLPHRPHEEKDKYAATSATSFLGHTETLTAVLLYQNYHIVHHLIPYLPFYEYSRVWFKHKAAMMERGTRIRSLFPIFLAKTTSKTNEQSTTERQQGVRHEKTG